MAQRKQISAACTIIVPLRGQKTHGDKSLPVLEGQKKFVPVIGRDKFSDGMKINILFDDNHFFFGLGKSQSGQ